MRSLNPVILRDIRHAKRGFTLIELVIIIAIFGILTIIAIPYFVGYMEKAKEEVCGINCLQSERQYTLYLEMEGIEHSELIFDSFLGNYDHLCPENGEISYVKGKFNCKIHSNDEEEEDVPYI